MRKLNIHPRSKLKLFGIAFILLFALLQSGCIENGTEIGKYQKLEPDLSALLSAAKFAGKEQGKQYKVSSILVEGDPLLKKLTDAGVINDGSFIVFSSENCLSLTTRIKHNGDSFTDKVVIHNLNEGQFACNINDLYTLNQDEKVNKLTIKVNRLSSLLSLCTVEN